MVKSMSVVALALAQTAVAIDYVGGWIEPAHQQCVDICKNSKATPSCFGPKTDACWSKLQRPGDYDYLLFDQIYQPQFCRDLLNGVDSTITHQNVNKYPVGIRCNKTEHVESELMIHGLWPNYINGYGGCCNVTDTIINTPFDASTFVTKYPDLFAQMAKEWVDPAIGNATEQLCQGYNHEYQKHGVCYGAFGNDWDKGAAQYFKATLDVNTRLKPQSAQIKKWAMQAVANPTVAFDAIVKLYPKKVNILCSKVQGEEPNRLVAIRTCFAKAADNCGTDLVAGEMIDCYGNTTTTCNPDAPIDLTSYREP